MKTLALVFAVLAAGLFSGAGASLGASGPIRSAEFLIPAVFFGCIFALAAIFCAAKSEKTDRKEL